MTRAVPLVIGALFVAGAVACLVSGRAPSTWGTWAHRPSVIYWVVTFSLALIGVMNLVLGVRAPR